MPKPEKLNAGYNAAVRRILTAWPQQRDAPQSPAASNKAPVAERLPLKSSTSNEQPARP